MGNHRSALPPKITPEQVLVGYQSGYFPMARGRDGKIDWFLAEPRTIIPLDDRFKVRRSLRQTMRKLDYRIRIDTDFPAVIRACARHDEVTADEVWLSEEMIALYIELHRRGFAHSVEVWTEDGLVGGLYGVSLRCAFFGESMFSRMSDASKAALASACRLLAGWGYALFDCQVPNPHLASLGAVLLPRTRFVAALSTLCGLEPAESAWRTFEEPPAR